MSLFIHVTTAVGSSCVCMLFPIYNYGNYHLYYAEFYDPCDNIPEDCNNPEVVYMYDVPGIPSQDCELGNCDPGWAQLQMEEVEEDLVRLAAPYPTTYDGADLAWNNLPKTTALQDIRFTSSSGEELRARLFRVRVDVGVEHSCVARFGCEIEDDGAGKIRHLGRLGNHDGNPYLYECRVGGHRYVIATSR